MIKISKMTQMCLAFCHIDVLVSFQSAHGLKLVWHRLTLTCLRLFWQRELLRKLGQSFNQTSLEILCNTTGWDGHGMTWALELGRTWKNNNNLPETDANVNVHKQVWVRLIKRKSIRNSRIRKWHWKSTQNSKMEICINRLPSSKCKDVQSM